MSFDGDDLAGSSPSASASPSLSQLIFCALVVLLVYRYLTSSPQAQDAGHTRSSGTTNSTVPADAVEALRAMFPQVSVAAIWWDLERNGGSVEATTEKILAEGSLPEVSPGSFFLPCTNPKATMSLNRIGSFPAQPDRVWCAVPHPHLPLVATASTDRVVRIYSLRDFSLVSTIEGGHKRSIRSLAWKPNSKGESVLATASFDSTTGIWHRSEHARDPQPIIGGDEENEISQSDEREEEEEWRFAVVLDGHDSEVKSVAWSPGGSFLATCSRDKTVWIWEEMEGDNYETVAVLQEHSQDVKMVVWHPTEELLASASYDDTVRLYKEDVDDWVCCAVLTGHTSTVWAISFENAGPQSRLASASDDQTVRIWHRQAKAPPAGETQQPSIIKQTDSELQDWQEQSCLPKAHNRTIYSIDWSKTTGFIATAGGDGRIVVYREEDIAEDASTEDSPGSNRKEWKVVAQIPSAHGVYEINSIAWCSKWDKQGARTGEEILLSTGDDGVVNVFELKL
ncbi:Coronin-2B [Drechslerella dactyloides]|uniref:Probable cytosolic iron-sulfur protein assembly protein 1 n=1 Tax=Drechslerella dactyloides TaxID=74499 RepID=A0AAD6NP34_DREDA|nr:Coronin-2B [Drechslerella dactyloides]